MELTALVRSIGAQVRNQRIALGLTQKELANQAGVSERLIRSLEVGTARGVGLGKLVDILSALNLELAIATEGVGTSSSSQSSVSQGAEYSDMLQKTVGEWHGNVSGEVSL